MSDVGRRSSAATRSGHDVTGTDINLNFPDSKFGSTARLGSSDVAPDRRPTRNRPRLESWLVSVHLTRVALHLSPGAAGLAAGTLTRLAMIATAISKRVETDHNIAYVTDLEQYGLHALRA